MHYFDCNATIPIWENVHQTTCHQLKTNWGNPSTLYGLGTKAYIAIDQARGKLANHLQSDPKDIIFTSGATENAHTVFQALYHFTQGKGRIGINILEHNCVWEAAKKYFPHTIDILPILPNGIIDLEKLTHYIKHHQPSLIACMTAHNIWGTIQPWPKIQKLCREHQVLFFTDAVQWVGRYSADKLGLCDFVSISSHKIGGPPGIGALKMPTSQLVYPLFPGSQQNGWRSGTEPTALILGFIQAIQENENFIQTVLHDRITLQQRIYRHFQEELPIAQLIGDSQQRLWNTLSFYIPEKPSHHAIRKLDQLGFQIANRAACGDSMHQSILAQTLKLPTNFIDYQIRLSSHWLTTYEDWLHLIKALKQVYLF